MALPVIKIEKGEACVAPVGEMRRDHMKMLFHQRDRTMRQGLRAPRFSLKGCVDCHASRETGQRARQGRVLLELPRTTPP